MTGDTAECWMQFCEHAARGQDPVKLIALVKAINRRLQEGTVTPDDPRDMIGKGKHAARTQTYPDPSSKSST